MTLYGYARVSVREPEDKNLDLQVERLVRAGCAMGNIRAREWQRRLAKTQGTHHAAASYRHRPAAEISGSPVTGQSGRRPGKLKPMEALTLTLHKSKDTKNIDKDALGDAPPTTIQVLISP